MISIYELSNPDLPVYRYLPACTGSIDLWTCISLIVCVVLHVYLSLYVVHCFHLLKISTIIL